MNSATTPVRSADRAPTLIVGGTGKTGRRVAARLASAGQPVRIGSRSAATPFSWEQPASWPVVLDGVRRAYVAYHPDFAAATAASGVWNASAPAGGRV